MESNNPPHENNDPANKNLPPAKNGKWIAVRREYEIDATNKTLKKIVKEKEKNDDAYTKKEKIDLWFRGLGSVAIFIPLLLFSLNKCVTDSNEHKKYEQDVYGAIKTDILFMLNKSVYSRQYAEAKDDLFFKQYPKLGYINNKKVMAMIDTIEELFKCYQFVSETKIVCDSIEEICTAVYVQVNTSYYTNGGHIRSFEKQKADTSFYKRNFTYFNKLKNELKAQKDELSLLASSVKLGDHYHNWLLRTKNMIHDSLDADYTSHFDDLEDYLEALQNKASPIDQGYGSIEVKYYGSSDRIIHWNYKKLKTPSFFADAIKMFQMNIKRINDDFGHLTDNK